MNLTKWQLKALANKLYNEQRKKIDDENNERIKAIMEKSNDTLVSLFHSYEKLSKELSEFSIKETWVSINFHNSLHTPTLDGFLASFKYALKPKWIKSENEIIRDLEIISIWSSNLDEILKSYNNQ